MQKNKYKEIKLYIKRILEREGIFLKQEQYILEVAKIQKVYFFLICDRKNFFFKFF